MAVIVKTSTPHTLLEEIKKKVSEGDSIQTWLVDKDGDFTHSPDQWKNRAWLRPVVVENEIRFKILTPKGKVLSRQIYAIYHGRFIEMLLAHFDTKFTDAIATAMPRHGDIVNPTN